MVQQPAVERADDASEAVGFDETLEGPFELPPPPRPTPDAVEQLAGQLLGSGEAPPNEFPAVPGYDVISVLGRGGMGVVYLARQRRLNRLVALKMLRAAGPDAAARFRTEVEAIARLQHPNIVQIFEVGEHAGRPFCALEYVDGGTLARSSREAPLSAAEAAGVIETLADAVQYAHDRGVLHRDLKPANILLTVTGRPKVTDFGLAKWLDGHGPDGSTADGRTGTGVIIGTPSYMAPEQVAGGAQPVGVTADVYALGAILYELLVGRPPFKADTPLETIRQTLDDEPLAPRRLQPRLPRDLETLCVRCLAKEPDLRYPSAAALADDLRRFRAGAPILARPAGAVVRSRKWVRRHPTAAVLTAAGAFLLLTLSAAGWVMAHHSREHARQLAEERDAADHARIEKDLYLRQTLESAERLGNLVNVVPIYSAQRDLLKETYRAYRQLREREAPTDDPAMLRVRATNFDRLANVTSLLGQHAEAAEVQREGIGRYRALGVWVDQMPRAYRVGWSLGRLGLYLRLAGQYGDAESALRESLDHLRPLVQAEPERREYRFGLGRTLEYLAKVVLDGPNAGRLPEVQQLITEGIEHQWVADPRMQSGRARIIFANLNLLMAESFLRQRDHVAAADQIRHLFAMRPTTGQYYADAAGLLQRCARLAAEDPGQSPEQRKRLSAEYAAEAKRAAAEAKRLGVKADPPE